MLCGLLNTIYWVSWHLAPRPVLASRRGAEQYTDQAGGASMGTGGARWWEGRGGYGQVRGGTGMGSIWGIWPYLALFRAILPLFRAI